MDVHTIIGFGVAVSLPVWLLLEEIARRRDRRMTNKAARKGRARRERETAGALKRPAAAVSTQAMSRLGMAG